MKPQTIAQFLKANLLYSCTLNVVTDSKKKMVEFDAITKYINLEHVQLSYADVPLWDLFGDFNSTKNAIACLLYCIEEKSGITPEVMKQQSKLTPKKEMPKAAGYSEFIATLTPEEKTYLLKIAGEWLNAYCAGDTSLDAFFINGTNGLTLKEGDLIMGYDAVYSQAVATRVFQANPNGFVQCVDNGGTFTLSKAINPRVVKAEEIGVELAEELAAIDAQQRMLLGEDRDKVVSQVEKRKEAAEKLAQAEKTRAEKVAKDKEAAEKANKAKEAEFNKLNELILDTPEKIEAAVSKLNAAKLPKEAHTAIHNKLKAAKSALTTKNVTKVPGKATKSKADQPAPAKAQKNAANISADEKNAKIAALLNEESEESNQPAPTKAAKQPRKSPGSKK